MPDGRAGVIATGDTERALRPGWGTVVHTMEVNGLSRNATMRQGALALVADKVAILPEGSDLR